MDSITKAAAPLDQAEPSQAAPPMSVCVAAACSVRPANPLVVKLARFGIGVGDTPLLECRRPVRWLAI